MVLVCLQNNRDTVSCASLESLFLKLIAIFIKAGGTHRQTRCRRLYCQARDRLSLGKVADGYHGRGDLLLGNREGCVLNSHALVDSAVVSIRLSSDSVVTSICILDSQLIAVDTEVGGYIIALCILHLESDEAGDVLVGGRRCAQSEHFVAAVCDFRLIDGGAANSRCLTAYRHGIFFYSNRVLNVICLARGCTLFRKFVNLQSKRSISGLNIIFNLKQIICNINRCAGRHVHTSAGSTADFCFTFCNYVCSSFHFEGICKNSYTVSIALILPCIRLQHGTIIFHDHFNAHEFDCLSFCVMERCFYRDKIVFFIRSCFGSTIHNIAVFVNCKCSKRRNRHFRLLSCTDRKHTQREQHGHHQKQCK